MKLYNNDFQKAKYLVQTLDPQFLTQHTKLSKFYISRLKDQDVMKSDTIEKFINIKSSLNLDHILDLFYNDHDLPEDWENLTLINLQTQEELVSFTLLLRYFNNNPQRLSRLEFFIKTKPNKFIESVYSNLFPHDESRNLLQTKNSLLLHKTLTSQLISQGTKIFSFYGEGASDLIHEEYQAVLYNAAGADSDIDLASDNFISSKAKNIINYFRAQTANDLFNLEYGFSEDDSIRSVSSLISLLSLDPEPFIAFDIINQYTLFLNNPSGSQQLVTYEDGTQRYEDCRDDNYDFLSDYFLLKSKLSPELITKLKRIGFIEDGLVLKLDLYKVS